ncbi:N-acetyl sugar amidotransferase [Geobacter sp. DSM 9736]|uniref:N-acetyl sugar amidotransferase n=1 Tax=Geobacter sp. DSM 9736 TaxID=1277350 RepID=UPI000B511FC4|nr:N-acetyl sugar amidotransferase [Geobacter sp. DSM 9736]SNB45046.1 N-acetyl sugar amidotransferase [Geobacter sp. DSM 9736]
MIYCKKCLQPNTRPNIKFNEEGVCPGCLYAATLVDVDWASRQSILKEICEFGRAHNSSGYDCIIGVSGGKDSTRQALYVKHVLKLKPLLVSCIFPPEQITHRGAYNVENMIKHGFDTVTIGPAPGIWRENMRHGFFKYGNWQKSTELALFSTVPRLATAYQIPLIFWGENPALTLGELGTNSLDYEGNQMKHGNTLAGGDPSWMFSDNIKLRDLLCYSYPSDEDMERAKLRIIYLGYFWKIWSKKDNGSFSCLHGLDIRDDRPEDMGDIMGVDALDEDWMNMNQMIKYRKFGFGRVTEFVNEEIRFGRMTREEGINLVTRYDGKISEKIIADYCRYLEISVEEFHRVVDSFTNEEIFQRDARGEWKLRYPIGGTHAQ